jgi:hypothetical protein
MSTHHRLLLNDTGENRSAIYTCSMSTKMELVCVCVWGGGGLSSRLHYTIGPSPNTHMHARTHARTHAHTHTRTHTHTPPPNLLQNHVAPWLQARVFILRWVMPMPIENICYGQLSTYIKKGLEKGQGLKAKSVSHQYFVLFAML